MNARVMASSFALSLVFVLPAGCILVIDGDGHLSHGHFGPDETVRGSGVSKTEDRTVADFQRLVVEGSPGVSIRVGEAKALTVSGDDNLVPWVTTQVQDGTLTIGIRPGSYSARQRLTVLVSVPALESVRVRGSSDVEAAGLAGGSFAIEIHGSGNVRASGKVDRLEVGVSGSGDVRLDDLESREAQISVAGSGDVDVWSTETLSVSIAGSGDVRYKGEPRVTQSVAGSGSVVRR